MESAIQNDILLHQL